MILASIPRCGSTYLFRSIAGMDPGGSTPEGAQAKHGITKTHRPPPTDPDGPALFLFGDVPEAVVSTSRYRMDATHFANCGAAWPPEGDIMTTDLLGYTDLWNAWLYAPYPVLFVRYRAMRHTHIRRQIEAWLGRDVQWLPWKPRRTKVTEPEVYQVVAGYAALMDATDAAPDLFTGGA